MKLNLSGILLLSGQLVVGVVDPTVLDSNSITVIKPRVALQVQQGSRTGVQLGEYLGSPDSVSIRLQSVAVSYSIKDPNVEQLYLKVSTGLTLATKIPPPAPQN